MEQIAKCLVKSLISTHRRIAVAESCTGGLLAAALTAVPGSSACFDYGVVSYSNEAKMALLGVAADVLRMYGAVSEQTAAAMASGVAAIRHTDVALATTGIAGPGGGSAEKPVGLVYISCYAQGQVFVDRCHFTGEREDVRRQAVEYALKMVLEQITGAE